MSKAKFMGVLPDELSSSSGSDSEGEDARAECSLPPDQPAAGTSGRDAALSLPEIKPAKRVKLTLEDLQRAGYTSGQSLMYGKGPTAEEAQLDYNWGDGRAAKEQEEERETEEERAATRHAVGAGLEDAMAATRRALAQAAAAKEAARVEAEELREQKRLSFNQKEKRKRDAGMQSRGKNYVEEEKRQARAHGVYSGFD